MTVAHRIRTGIRRYSDGWNVVVEIDGKVSVYDPAYSTEAEAEAKANEVAALWRETIAKHGGTVA